MATSPRETQFPEWEARYVGNELVSSEVLETDLFMSPLNTTYIRKMEDSPPINCIGKLPIPSFQTWRNQARAAVSQRISRIATLHVFIFRELVLLKKTGNKLAEKQLPSSRNNSRSCNKLTLMFPRSRTWSYIGRNEAFNNKHKYTAGLDIATETKLENVVISSLIDPRHKSARSPEQIHIVPAYMSVFRFVHCKIMIPSGSVLTGIFPMLKVVLIRADIFRHGVSGRWKRSV